MNDHISILSYAGIPLDVIDKAKYIKTTETKQVCVSGECDMKTNEITVRDDRLKQEPLLHHRVRIVLEFEL